MVFVKRKTHKQQQTNYARKKNKYDIDGDGACMIE